MYTHRYTCVIPISLATPELNQNKDKTIHDNIMNVS